MNVRDIKPQSYSSLSKFEQCPYSYKLQYIDKNFSTQSSIQLDIGNLVHYILQMKEEGCPASELSKILRQGITPTEDLCASQTQYENTFAKPQTIIGAEAIAEKYFDEYFVEGKNSRLNYSQKLDWFEEHYILQDVQDKEWKTLAVEMPFEFLYNGLKIKGKIDKLQVNKDLDFKIVDYKSSDSSYDEDKLKAPLQLYIYALAIKSMFGKFPKLLEYEFILIGERQSLEGTDWYDKAEKKLFSLTEKLKDAYITNIFPPKPTPLCYWDAFSPEGCIKDEKLNGKCEYYSLWKPFDKTFRVNKKWDNTNNQTFEW